jgi:hypothetical protein
MLIGGERGTGGRWENNPPRLPRCSCCVQTRRSVVQKVESGLRSCRGCAAALRSTVYRDLNEVRTDRREMNGRATLNDVRDEETFFGGAFRGSRRVRVT